MRANGMNWRPWIGSVRAAFELSSNRRLVSGAVGLESLGLGGNVAALVGSGRLGSKSAHGEAQPLDNLRCDPLRLVVPLAARVALLVADLVGLCGRGLLPRNLI